MKAMSSLKCECGGTVMYESRSMNIAICTKCKKRYMVKDPHTGTPQF